MIAEMGLGVSVQPVAGAFGQFVRELDGVPTADPALVDGRNAWRSAAELFAQLGPPRHAGAGRAAAGQARPFHR